MSRLIVVVPDKQVIIAYRDYLAENKNFHGDIEMFDYAGHLVNYFNIKLSDFDSKTIYPQPRRVNLLNGQHKPFRLYIVYKLWQAGLIDKMQVTYWNKFGYSTHRDIPEEELIQDIAMVARKSLGNPDIDPEFRDLLKSLPLTGGINREESLSFIT